MKYGLAFEIDEEEGLVVWSRTDNASLPHIISILEEHLREKRQEFREEYQNGSHLRY